MGDPGVVVVPAVPLLPPLAGQQDQAGGVGVDEAAPALQRGRRGAAVLQLASISGYHHFSASLRASNNGNGTTSAGVASASAGCSARLSAPGPGPAPIAGWRGLRLTA